VAAETLLYRQDAAVLADQQPPSSADQLLTLAEACNVKWLPRRRRGARTNRATIHRWSDPSRPIHLKTVRVGGTRCTTERWLREFFDALADKPATPTPAARTPHRRTVDQAAAERALADAGIG
jgi:hypothetical protein